VSFGLAGRSPGFYSEEVDMVHKASKVRVGGPLASWQVSFERVLAAAGYTPLSAANQLRVMAHLSRWLELRGLVPADLGPDVVEAYLVGRREAGYTCWLSPRGVAPLLGHLQGLGVVPSSVPEVASGALEELLERYRVYLVGERGLVARTVRYYVAEARLFFAGRVGDDDSRLRQLVAGDVAAFVVDECARRSVGSAKILVTVLRSLLRFLFLEAVTGQELAAAVPAVAGWRGSHLPKGISPAEVSCLLASCDRGSGVGRRDRAILTLLVRLGLRGCEVARLGLDDIDWRRGEVMIRGKGRREERLPLPVDVGEAIVDYVHRDRAGGAGRAMFCNVRAPFAAMTVGGVQSVVGRAGVRAGLGWLGAHRLRHTTATQLLRAHTPLVEIGQVLRHRSVATTAIYAKVDRVALRSVAQPWPGATA
jgi:integrase/recombinase XerD